MAERPERLYSLRGKALTAAQVAELDDVTDAEKHAFALQAGLSDQRLKEIEALMGAMAQPIRDFVEKSIRPVVDSVVTLRSKIAELEQRPPIDWSVYDEKRDYPVGAFVTSSGSLWIAKAASKGVRPGAGNDCWRLCVKRGDAK